jgi:hypothetical protein
MMEVDGMDKYSPKFAERLSHFGIQEDVLTQKSIAVKADVHWDDLGAPFKVKVVETSDLDEIKRLIGNNDSDFEKGIVQESPAMKSVAALKDVKPEKVKDAASAYVFGNSKNVKHLKATIEKQIGTVRVQVAAATEFDVDHKITITGKEPKVITADIVRFMKGGQIYNEGIFTLNAGTIKQDKT